MEGNYGVEKFCGDCGQGINWKRKNDKSLKEKKGVTTNESKNTAAE